MFAFQCGLISLQKGIPLNLCSQRYLLVSMRVFLSVNSTFDRLVFILQANNELEMARTEIARLHAERERYEETMKKAFMRGVCALNLEAMSMFREGEEGGRRPPPSAVNSNGGTQSGTFAVV